MRKNYRNGSIGGNQMGVKFSGCDNCGNSLRDSVEWKIVCWNATRILSPSIPGELPPRQQSTITSAGCHALGRKGLRRHGARAPVTMPQPR